MAVRLEPIQTIGAVNRIKDGTDDTSKSRSRTDLNPFDALEADWKALCWRHRRSTIVARWAR